MATRDERLARVRQVLDRELGEPVRVTPMRTGNYGRAADPARQPFDVVAKIKVGDGKASRLDGSKAQSFEATLPLNEAEALVDPALWPDTLTVVQGDVVELLSPERRTQSQYEVARIDRGQLSRIVFRLSAL